MSSINLYETLPVCAVLDCKTNSQGACTDLTLPQAKACTLSKIQEAIDKSGANVQEITIEQRIDTSLREIGIKGKLILFWRWIIHAR